MMLSAVKMVYTLLVVNWRRHRPLIIYVAIQHIVLPQLEIVIRITSRRT